MPIGLLSGTNVNSISYTKRRAQLYRNHAAYLDFTKNKYRLLSKYTTSTSTLGTYTRTGTKYEIDTNAATTETYGNNLVNNGTFDTNTTGWSLTGSSMTVVNGRLETTGNFSGAYQVVPVTIGRSYLINADCYSGSVGPNLRLGHSAISSSEYGSLNTVGASKQIVALTSNLYLSPTTGGNGSAQFDNITVREVTSTYKLRSFSANQPGVTSDGIFCRVPVTNLVINSINAELSSLAGCTVAVNTAIAPDGTMTADRVIESNVNETHRIGLNAGLTAGTSYTMSAFLKAGTRDLVNMTTHTGSSAQLSVTPNVVFNLTTGTIVSGTGTIIPVGGGWYRCSTEFATDVTWTSTSVGCRGYKDGTSTYLGDGASGYYIWGMQIVTGSLPGPLVITNGSTTATVGADDFRGQFNTPLVDEDFYIMTIVDYKGTGDRRGPTLMLDTSNTIGVTSVGAWGVTAGGVTQPIGAGVGGPTGFNAIQTRPATSNYTGRMVMLIRRKNGYFSVFYKHADGSLYANNENTLGNMPMGMNSIRLNSVFNHLPPNSPIQLFAIRKGTFTDAQILSIMQAA